MPRSPATLLQWPTRWHPGHCWNVRYLCESKTDSKGRVTAGALLVSNDLAKRRRGELLKPNGQCCGNLAPSGGIRQRACTRSAFHAYIWPSVLRTGDNIIVTLAWHDGSGARSYGLSLSCAFTGNWGKPRHSDRGREPHHLRRG
jgi:hypothetical protein